MSFVRPPMVNLLALPCAGASATMYLRWQRLLPEWIRVVPVELPGRGSRLGEPFIGDFAELVALVCAERSAQLNSRYALFGHSMGALLCHAIARRQCANKKVLPLALFASASPAPSRRDTDYFAGKCSDAALIADLRKQGGTPEEVFGNTEMLRITLDTLRADYRVCGSFRYAAAQPLPIPIRVFAGRDDDIAIERIDAWQREAGDEFSVDWFDGNHFFIRQNEQGVVNGIVRELVRRSCRADDTAAFMA